MSIDSANGGRGSEAPATGSLSQWRARMRFRRAVFATTTFHAAGAASTEELKAANSLRLPGALNGWVGSSERVGVVVRVKGADFCKLLAKDSAEPSDEVVELVLPGPDEPKGQPVPKCSVVGAGSTELVTITHAARSELPPPLTLMMSKELARRISRRIGLSRWTLVTPAGEDGGASVALRVRTTDSLASRTDLVRMAMDLRTVSGIKENQACYLTKPLRSGPLFAWLGLIPYQQVFALWGSAMPERVSRRRVLKNFLRVFWVGGVLAPIRFANLVLESVLRVVFRAPALVMRTTPAEIGDDSQNIVRLHPSTLRQLGVTPGSPVTLSKGGYRVSALAYETTIDHGAIPRDFLQGMRAAGQHTEEVPQGFPPYLLIGATAGIRRDLGMPSENANAVVEVRRLVRPIVLRHLGTLMVPSLGLLLAAQADGLEHLKGWPTYLGLVLIAAVGLASVRMPRARFGPWP